MKFKEIVDKAKHAPKKDLAMGILCLVGTVALLVWFIASFF